MAEVQAYQVKLFDEPLAQFEFVQDGPGACYARNLEIDPATRHLLPMNLAAEPTDDELGRFLNTRRIPKNRAYVEEILAACGIEPGDTKGIIDVTKGVSVNDSYLVVAADDTVSFAECNLFDNDFDVALQIAAYTGVISGDALAGGLPSELTASGSFPKAWRIVDGKRVLFKAGGISLTAERCIEPYSELLAYQVAQAMGVRCVPYELARWQGKVCSTCELFNTRDVSFVPIYSALPRLAVGQFGLNRALELYFGISPEDSTELLSMLVFDSVVANKDRHFGNFGVLRDNATGDLLRMAPLFDHNMSLFCGEPDNRMGLDDLLAARRRYAGTFATNLEAQLDYSMEDAQREQLARLAGFEFSIPAEFAVYAQDNPEARDAFPAARLDALNRYIQHVAA